MSEAISAQDAQNLLVSGQAILIDVREPDEFRTSHIPNAMSLPLSNVANTIDQLSIPDGKTVIFQCFKGSRGQQACAIAQAKVPEGHVIRNLEGGITAWKEAGLPVMGAASTGISIFRQVQMIVGSLIAICVLLSLNGFPAAIFGALFFACALAFAGVTGWCGLAQLLGVMPWNKA